MFFYFFVSDIFDVQHVLESVVANLYLRRDIFYLVIVINVARAFLHILLLRLFSVMFFFVGRRWWRWLINLLLSVIG